MNGFDIAKAYSKGELCGWAEVRQPGIAREQFNLLRKSFSPLIIQNPTRIYKGKKAFLYQVVRKVLGQDTKNYPQQIGDCVSFGAKNCVEYLQCCDMLMRGVREKWRPIFPPYLYGTGRVYVGKGRLGNDDGSLGSWMAEAIVQYGALFADETGVPQYSGSIAKHWGDPNPQDDLDKWSPNGKQHLVKATALINSWSELVESLVNGYSCPTASDIGYSMEASSDGFHRQTDTWGHQMCFIGADDNDKDPYALILNNWGDCHGHLKDFDTGEDLPLPCRRNLRLQQLHGFPRARH